MYLPFFPDSLPELDAALNEADLNKILLDSICYKFEEFRGSSNLTTDDGYTWYVGLSFKLGKFFLTIAIPWANDSSMEGGSKQDRSIAVYAPYGAISDHVNALIRRLIPLIREAGIARRSD